MILVLLLICQNGASFFKPRWLCKIYKWKLLWSTPSKSTRCVQRLRTSGILRKHVILIWWYRLAHSATVNSSLRKTIVCSVRKLTKGPLVRKRVRFELTLWSYFTGMLCCARYTEDDMWYRAQVKTVERQKPLEVRVVYVDYGTTEVVTADR